jgi:GTP cyclohydrolase III
MSDIAELFARDPQEMSDKDIDKIVEHMRAKRAQFKAGVTPSRTKVSAEAQAAAAKLDLKDLGL